MARSEVAGEFGHHLRTGRRAWPIEVKFNHNHDPDSGRFTSGGGGGGGKGSARSSGHAVPRGPFREAAMRNDAIGRTARAVNSFVHGESASMTLPLGSGAGDLTVQRVNGSKVNREGRFFSAEATLDVVPGREEIVSSLANPDLKVPFAKILAFPTHVRIFQAVSGNVIYSLNRALSVTSPIRNFHRAAGDYVPGKAGQ